jgi:hypothetical protein
MSHRHRSRVVRVAWLLGGLAVAAVAAGLVLGGPALAVAAVTAAVAAVGAAVLARRTETRGRVALASQRSELDAELDRRLALVREGHDAGTALLQAQVERADRDRQQLELALQMAMLRRESPRRGAHSSAVHAVDRDEVGGDVTSIRLDRAS